MTFKKIDLVYMYDSSTYIIYMYLYMALMRVCEFTPYGGFIGVTGVTPARTLDMYRFLYYGKA
jgi:hypothetical protein